jgi:hypothetical protein
MNKMTSRYREHCRGRRVFGRTRDEGGNGSETGVTSAKSIHARKSDKVDEDG